MERRPSSGVDRDEAIADRLLTRPHAQTVACPVSSR